MLIFLIFAFPRISERRETKDEKARDRERERESEREGGGKTAGRKSRKSSRVRANGKRKRKARYISPCHSGGGARGSTLVGSSKREREREGGKGRETERAGISSREAAGSPWKFTGARVTATCLWLVGENLARLARLLRHPPMYTAARLSHPRLRAKGRQGFGSVVGWRRRHRRVGKRDEEASRGGRGSHSLEGREEADGKGGSARAAAEGSGGRNGIRRVEGRSRERRREGGRGGGGDEHSRDDERLADHAEVGRLALSLSSPFRRLSFSLPLLPRVFFVPVSIPVSLARSLPPSLPPSHPLAPSPSHPLSPPLSPSGVSSRLYLFLSLLLHPPSPSLILSLSFPPARAVYSAVNAARPGRRTLAWPAAVS